MFSKSVEKHEAFVGRLNYLLVICSMAVVEHFCNCVSIVGDDGDIDRYISWFHLVWHRSQQVLNCVKAVFLIPLQSFCLRARREHVSAFAMLNV